MFCLCFVAAGFSPSIGRKLKDFFGKLVLPTLQEGKGEADVLQFFEEVVSGCRWLGGRRIFRVGFGGKLAPQLVGFSKSVLVFQEKGGDFFRSIGKVGQQSACIQMAFCLEDGRAFFSNHAEGLVGLLEEGAELHKKGDQVFRRFSFLANVPTGFQFQKVRQPVGVVFQRLPSAIDIGLGAILWRLRCFQFVLCLRHRADKVLRMPAAVNAFCQLQVTLFQLVSVNPRRAGKSHDGKPVFRWAAHF